MAQEDQPQAQQQTASAALLQAQIYPIAQPPRGPYPEQSIPRYSADRGLWAACFSGGGPRSFAASLGQMRGLHAAGVLPFFGAISCVSGGSWFGSLFSFAPAAYTDAQLLGPAVKPEDITVASLNQMQSGNLGNALLSLTNINLGLYFTRYLTDYYLGYLPFDKVWARVLNSTLLQTFQLDDTATLLTLNAQTLAAIRGRNPGLDADFFTLRADTPFFVAGSTQVYPLASLQHRDAIAIGRSPRIRATLAAAPEATVQNLPGQIYRHFEYTPGYTGTAQFFPNAGPGGVDFGNGYVESFAFDTPTPLRLTTPSVAAVPSGKFPFLLSDVIGSSSAALASLMDWFGYSGGFSYFDYWPIRNISKEPAVTYSFGDGGILENTGIVPLLRRGYRVIFAFVNTPFPVNSDDPGCVSGIDGQISRLFGLIPQEDYGNSQNTQIFATSQFAPLAAGLKAARAAGKAVVYSSQFPILPNNPFDLAPYTPTIFWLYNDLDASWFNRLPISVRQLFANSPPLDYLGNFPNYATVGQNESLDDYEYEVLYLTPRQINLLAHMWCTSVQDGFQSFSTTGQAFNTAVSPP